MITCDIPVTAMPSLPKSNDSLDSDRSSIVARGLLQQPGQLVPRDKCFSAYVSTAPALLLRSLKRKTSPGALSCVYDAESGTAKKLPCNSMMSTAQSTFSPRTMPRRLVFIHAQTPGRSYQNWRAEGAHQAQQSGNWKALSCWFEDWPARDGSAHDMRRKRCT